MIILISKFFKKHLTLVVLATLIFSPLASTSHRTAEAAINEQINYQGKLTDSSGVAVGDGTYEMEFKLYTAASGGTAIWTETRDGVDEVQVTSGIFSVLLGEVTALTGVDFNQTLYLGVKIEADAEMTPRKKIGAVPAAILAKNALTVTTNANLTGPITSVGNTTSVASQTGTGSTFVMNTSPTLVTPNLGTPSALVLTNATGLPASSVLAGTFGTGAYVMDTSLSVPSLITASGALGITPAAGSNLNVNLSTTGDFAVNTDQLYVDTSAGYVGIGTASPSSQLHVNNTTTTHQVAHFQTNGGNLKVKFTDNQGDAFIYKSGQSIAFGINDGATNNLIVNSSGAVAIGTTTPLHKLDVRGDIAAPNNRIIAQNFCDEYGQNCYSPRLNSWTRMGGDGNVSSSVKIASGTNGGPTLVNEDRFGVSVAGIGDLNGDGIPDLVVGAELDDTGGTNKGAAHVLFMNRVGAVASSVKIAHETNGGPTIPGSDLFGHSVAGIGDLNGDGIPDLAVGAYLDDTGGTDRGSVYVLFMNRNGTVASSVKIASGTNGGPTLVNVDRFGSSVSGIGDLNGDGIPDLVVGASLDDTGGTNRGATHILFMNSNGTVASSVKIASETNGGPTLVNNDEFGASVAGIGDLNGDGIPDLVVGASGDDTGGASSNRGAVHVLFMNRDGTVASSQKIAHETNGGPTLVNTDNFGRSVSSTGDLNGDGVPDIVVGASGDDTGGTDRGASYVLFMNRNGSASSVAKIASGTNGGPTLVDSDNFGYASAGIGDLNGDGIPDIAIGAYLDDTGGTDRGAAHVLFMAKNNVHFAGQNVGIGITSPSEKLSILGNMETITEGGSNIQYSKVFSSASASHTAAFISARSRGTIASPAGVEANDRLGQVSFRGALNTGAMSGDVSLIAGWANQAFTSSNRGSYLTFETTPDNSTTRAERMRIDNAGKVGIGTTPVELLHVRESSTRNAFQLGDYGSLSTLHSSGATVIGNNVKAAPTGTNAMHIQTTNASIGGRAIRMGSDTGITFHSQTGSVTAGDTFTSELMRLTNTGDVGIGTTDTTGGKLVVAGTLAMPRTAAATVGDPLQPSEQIRFFASRWNSGSPTNAGLRIRGAYTSDATADLALQVLSNATTPTPLVTIKDGGDVGIGNTAPVNNLDVWGTVAAPATSGTDKNGQLRLSSVNTAVSLDMGVLGSPAYAWIQPRARTSYATNYNLALNPNGGNVGIGEVAPTGKLDIVGGVTNLLLSDVSTNESTKSIRVGGRHYLSAEEPVAIIFNQNSVSNNVLSYGGGTSVFNTATLHLWYAAANNTTTTGTEMMRLTTVGLGIGGSPTTKLEIGSADLGDGAAGPIITLGRNTNATNTGAGSINFMQKGGTAGYVWQDAAGNMRIHTAAPSNANDTAGTVIGAQTSTRETKQDIADYTDYMGALTMVLESPLHTFRYKKEVAGYGTDSPLAKARIGYIAEEVNPAFMVGNSIDQVSVNGILMASIKGLNLNIEGVEDRLAALEANIGLSGGGTISALGEFAVEFFSAGVQSVVDGIAYMKGIVTERLTVGSREKPTGITLYDEATGEPNCFSIINGNVSTTLGECTVKDLASASTSPYAGGGAEGGGGTYSPADGDSPIITLDGDVLISLNVGDTYTESGALATDDSDTELAIIISGSVDTNTPGTYVISYNATDSYGNTATATRTIKVATPDDETITSPLNEPQPEADQPSAEEPEPATETESEPTETAQG